MTQTAGQSTNVPGFVLERIAARLAATERMAAAPGEHGYSNGWAEGAAYVLEMLSLALPEPTTLQQPTTTGGA